MMKTNSRLQSSRAFAVFFVLAACGSLAFSQDADRRRSQINPAATDGSPGQDDIAVREAEARWLDVLERRDGEALRSLLGEDFVDITWKGELRDRGAAIAALNAPGRPSMTRTLQEVRVRFAAPDVAVVTGVNAVSSKAPDFKARVRFTDIFVKRAGDWKALSAQETLERAD